jgi:hypothetical protein
MYSDNREGRQYIIFKGVFMIRKSAHFSLLVVVLVVVVMLWGASVVHASGGLSCLKDPATLTAIAVAELGALILGSIVILDTRRNKIVA